MEFIFADIPTLCSRRDELPCRGWREFYPRLMPGEFRSLTNREFIDFLEALQEMPWSWRNKTQGGAVTVPLTVNAE